MRSCSMISSAFVALMNNELQWLEFLAEAALPMMRLTAREIAARHSQVTTRS